MGKRKTIVTLVVVVVVIVGILITKYVAESDTREYYDRIAKSAEHAKDFVAGIESASSIFPE